MTAIFRLHYLKIELDSANPLFDGVPAVIWTQAELYGNVVAATIPVLKPFMVAVSTNYSSIRVRSVQESPIHSTHERPDTNFGLTSIISAYSNFPISTNPTRNLGTRPEVLSIDLDPLQPGQSANVTSVTSEGAYDAQSMGTNGSRNIILKREWTVDSVKANG